jgi:Lamin Tail Domain
MVLGASVSLASALALTIGCSSSAERRGRVLDGGSLNLCPSIDGIGADPSTAMVGKTVELSATEHDVDAWPAPMALTWTATSGTISDPASSNPTLTCTTAGAVTVTLNVTDGDCIDSQNVVVTCTPMAVPKAIVVINEVESNGGVPGDWVELYNAGDAPANLSGFIFRDNDDTHGYPIPAGTTLAAGGYFLLEEAAFGFGLGSADAARLFDATGTALVDSYSWTSHAVTTYGRCPNGVGSFATTAASTKGAANSCSTGGGPDGGVTLSSWPGANAVTIVDQVHQFSGNLSGLSYDPATSSGPAVLWGVQNSPSTLYRLLWNGATWASTTSDGWTAGKVLHYPDGTGTPDSEGVTKAEAASPAVYVSTERNGDAGTVSRLSVLRFDTSAPGAALTATNEWNLTGDLPAADANLGLEAITWIPDSFLVGAGFVDESTGQLYAPSSYANHGTGIFFVGLEANGTIYAFALDHVGGGFQRIATFVGGQASIMDLSFDRDVGYLWGYCDNTCANHAAVLMIDADPLSATHGHFRLSRLYDHPSTLPDVNNEGIAIAPESECVGGRKSFFWSDDSATGGNSLRRDSIPCGTF